MLVVIGWTQQQNSLALLLATRLGVCVARHHRPARHDYTRKAEGGTAGQKRQGIAGDGAALQIRELPHVQEKKKGKELLRVISLDRYTYV
jgi:hypothetical protein